VRPRRAEAGGAADLPPLGLGYARSVVVTEGRGLCKDHTQCADRTAIGQLGSRMAANRCSGEVELPGDLRFDVVRQRGVGSGDELAQHRNQRCVLDRGYRETRMIG
jgi:hypothetical protein